MRDFFIAELTKQAKIDSSILLVTGDLGFGVFDDYRTTLPNQFFNAGVAEQNMSAIACGLALDGHRVFTYSIGNFPTLRCLEQIRNDICYHNADVTIVCIGGGFSYGQLGVSHFATEDLSIIRAIPNITMLTPSSNNEVTEIIRNIDQIKGPKYLRLDKDSAPDLVTRTPFKLGEVNKLVDGSAATIIGVGGVINEALVASKILRERGISARVLSLSSLKPINSDEIVSAVKETPVIITLEENTIVGGVSSVVSEICLREAILPKKFAALGIPDVFPSIVGDQNYLRKHFNLDANSIVTKVLELQT